MVNAVCECQNDGKCIPTALGQVCACVGPWGGPRCSLYVGHDHACGARACTPPALCVWGPDPSGTQVMCTPPLSAVSATTASRAWVGTTLALVALAGLVLTALFMLRRRRKRRNDFMHARLTENMDISNAVYHAGEDEHEPVHNSHNGSGRFGNPVYDSMFTTQQSGLAPAASADTPVYSPLSLEDTDPLSGGAVATSPRSRMTSRRYD